MSEKQQAEVRAALKEHVKERNSLDKKQIALVQRAHKHGVPLQEVADTLNLSLRTVYNRLEGLGPRSGAKWRD